MNKQELQRRCFITYTGITLPLKLLNELDNESLGNRITYFAGYYDGMGRLKILEKVVYGEIEFTHHYDYNQDDKLEKAVLIEGDEPPRTLVFDNQGRITET